MSIVPYAFAVALTLLFATLAYKLGARRDAKEKAKLTGVDENV